MTGIDEGRRWNLNGGDWSHNEARPVWSRGNDGTNAAAPDTSLTDEVSMHALSNAIWVREVISRGLGHVRSASWATEVRDLPDGDFNGRHEGHREALYFRVDDPCVIKLGLSGGRVDASIAARNAAAVDSALEWAKTELPESEPVG